MSQSEADDTGYRGTNEGSKLAGNAGLWDDWDLESNAGFGTSGFTALPGRDRNINGSWYSVGRRIAFWSATENNSASAWNRAMETYTTNVIRYAGVDKSRGHTVRCLKD